MIRRRKVTSLNKPITGITRQTSGTKKREREKVGREREGETKRNGPTASSFVRWLLVLLRLPSNRSLPVRAVQLSFE